MKTIKRARIVFHCVASVLFVLGCSKVPSVEAQTSAASNAQQAKAEKIAVFEPSSSVKSSGIKSPQVDEAYTTAANACVSYSQSLPYERASILKNAIPALQRLAAANRAAHEQNPNAEDAAILARVDYKFSGLGNLPELNQVLPILSGPTESKSKVSKKFSVKDPGGLTERAAPSAGDGSPLRVTRTGPDSLLDAGANAGDAIGEGSRAMHLDGIMAHEVERLLGAVMKAGDAWTNVLQLQKADSLETRAAKLTVQSAFGDFLGKIIVQDGSFFLGVKQPGSPLEIWEFKQPITIGVEREEPDAETRLNTGIQLIAVVAFNPNQKPGTFRRFANGYWGTWKTFPKLGAIRVTKADNWVVEFSAVSQSPQYWRLSPRQIEMARARSETTRIIGRAEAGLSDDSPVENGQSLLEAYGAIGDVDGATKFATGLFQKENLEPAALKQAIAGLANLLTKQNSKMASDWFNARMFDYFKSYDSFPEDKSAKILYPKRGDEMHLYGRPFPSATVELLKQAYRQLIKAEPDNFDARFDFALLCMLGNKRDLQEADDNLNAVFKAKGKSLAGRDFVKLVTDSPCFIPLRAEQSPAESDFESILADLGSSDSAYFNKFSTGVLYFTAGY